RHSKSNSNNTNIHSTFFLHNTLPTYINPLSLHDALPIYIGLALQTLSSNLKLCAQHLVQTANDNGGRDNISVILVRVLRDYPARSEEHSLNSSHLGISYAVFCLKKKTTMSWRHSANHWSI